MSSADDPGDGSIEIIGGSKTISTKATAKTNIKKSNTVTAPSTSTKHSQVVQESSEVVDKSAVKTMAVPGTETGETTGKKEMQKQQPPLLSSATTSSDETEQKVQTEKTDEEEGLLSEPAMHCLLCQSRLQLDPSLFQHPNSLFTTVPTDSKLAVLDDVEDDEEVEGEEFSQKNGLAYETIREDPFSLADTSSQTPPSVPATALMCQSDGNWNLLELIGNSTNPFDVPMCKKCATSVSTELDGQLVELERECHQYKASLDQLVKQRADAPFDQDAARRQLEQLKAEEQDLLDQLNFLDKEEQTLQQRLEAKIEEQRKITERDEQLYRQLRDNHRKLIDQADEQRALKLQIRHADEQLQRLTKTNVMDMVFHIWVDGEFGTINGFRLGRLRHEQVEWNEINAALGQMTFLLKVISERLGMEFVGYELVPCGNFSFIRVQKNLSEQRQQLAGSSTKTTTTAEELPLYGNGGWRPFGQPALDKALVAFMDCFIQVEQRLKQYFPPGSQILPYRMLKDKIIDKDSQYLVKMQLNSEERWTKAMKCLLLNLKRVIAILIPLPSLVAAASANNNPQQQPCSSPKMANESGSSRNGGGDGNSAAEQMGKQQKRTTIGQ